jgi:hypothetical protein
MSSEISNKKFGLFFSCLFFSLSAYGVADAWGGICVWLLLISACVLLITSIFFDPVLKPANDLWFLVGEILHRVTSFVVFGLIFYSLITPIAITARALGRDLLHLKTRPKESSYWVVRPIDDVRSPEKYFKNQF